MEVETIFKSVLVGMMVLGFIGLVAAIAYDMYKKDGGLTCLIITILLVLAFGLGYGILLATGEI